MDLKARAIGGTALLALVVGMTMAGPAQAGGGNGYEVANFKVTIEGKQRVNWEKHSPDEGYCSVSYDNVGSETVKFKTKPVRVMAVKVPGEKRPELLVKDGLAKEKAKATVTRKNNEKFGPQDPLEECPGGGSGDPGLKRDCGTKRVSMPLYFGYDFVSKRRIFLSSEQTADPYRKCPGVGSYGFPWLVGQQHGSVNSRTLPELPPNELFDEKIGKIIVLGKGQQKGSSPSFSHQGKLNWNIEFKRLKTRS